MVDRDDRVEGSVEDCERVGLAQPSSRAAARADNRSRGHRMFRIVRLEDSGDPLSGYALSSCFPAGYDRRLVAAAVEERERLSWAQFGEATRELAVTIAEDEYRPDLILSVARGGLLVGSALGYALEVKNTWTMNVEFYTGIDERLDVPMILPPVPELVDLESARMLIADDVADTGETLRLVKDFCAGKVGEVRCAVLYEKSRSLVACEYVWKRTDLWIDFPWSAEPPVATTPVVTAGAASERG
jgi:hypoxanthine phosphoribosyltransferase